MTRGILWMTWGETPGLERSRASAKHWHPELEQHVARMPDDSTVLCKSRMYELSPFDETLFLDADTTVMGNLDYGFQQAKWSGMVLTHSACPWQRRYYKMRCSPDAVEYSSGVVFFLKTDHVGNTFAVWSLKNEDCDTRCKYVDDNGATREQLHNDQATLTLAIELTGHRFVLPQNWNFVPRWQKQFFGPLKILHGTEDIPQSLLKWNEEQSKPDAVIQCVALS